MDHADQTTVSLSNAGAGDAATVVPVTPVQVEVPRRLGSVELVREIGRGGMGVVWLGRDELLGRDVAVKFMLGAAAGDDDPHFATFLEGARAAAALRTPGITAVHHADVVAGSPYIVMEYVDGPSLARVIRVSKSLSVAAAWHVMRVLAGTVGELHDAGIVHRDIKPSNVMLDLDGRLFLTDFGVAILRRDDGGDVGRARLAGTPAYMAPEAFEARASARVDVYALGITLYEMLVGEPPFAADTLEGLRRLHETAEVPAERLTARGVGSAIVDIVDRALRKDPKFRFKSARHLLEAMDRVRLDPALLARGEPDLRAAAMTARVAVETRSSDGGEPSTASDAANRTLYDHMATIAARKRAAPHVPPSREADVVPFGIDSNLGPVPAPRLDPPPTGSDKAAGHHPMRESPSSTPEEDPVSPRTVAWIGLALFFLLAVAVAIWWAATR
ncbi:MAG: serine/threonine-protein kinase [Phycisphaerae bacterium]|jgi:serine/threonine-protein kinase